MNHTLTCWSWALQSSSLLPPHVLNQLLMQPIETTPCFTWCSLNSAGKARLCSWPPYSSIGTKRNHEDGRAGCDPSVSVSMPQSHIYSSPSSGLKTNKQTKHFLLSPFLYIYLKAVVYLAAPQDPRTLTTFFQ